MRGLIMAGLILVAAGLAMGEDAELARLKAAASETKATLAIKQTTPKLKEREYQNTEFILDTGAAKYRLNYKSFAGAGAKDNGALTDGCGGYGMLAPHTFWYWNGFLTVEVAGQGYLYTGQTQGVVRPLATEGARVGYDLVFENDKGAAVVRTVALAGRDELFISVSGRLKDGSKAALRTRFLGYPHGYSLPFDRWVHAARQDVQGIAGKETTAPLKLDDASWVLLADHKLDPDGKKAGLLGLVYDRKAITGATASTNNYSIKVNFNGPDAAEQRFLVYTFGPMKWEAARDKLAGVKDAAELLDKAFEGLPPALDAKAGG